MKLPISVLLAKFACFNIAARFPDVNSLNSWVVIYLSWLWSFILFSIFNRFFLAKLLVSVVLILSNFFNSLHSVFLTRSYFNTLFSLLKSTGTTINLSASSLSTLFFKLFKLVGTVISNLSTSGFKLAKSVFFAKDDVSTHVAFQKSALSYFKLAKSVYLVKDDVSIPVAFFKFGFVA